MGIIAAVVVLAGVATLLYFTVFSDDEDYCSVLEKHDNELDAVTSGEDSDDNLDQIVAAFHELRDAAPEEVADEWEQIDEPYAQLEEAINEAGVTWDEVVAMEQDEIPEELVDDVEKFSAEFNELDLSAILQTIRDHAKDECGIDLEDDGGETGGDNQN